MTFDDAPTIQIPRLLGDSLLAAEVSANNKLSRLDLVYVYDVSTRKPKVMTVREFGEALGVTFTGTP
jgi:hypothetical protein